MSNNFLPGQAAIERATKANRKFTPPIHERAGVTEDEFVIPVAILDEERVLLSDGAGSYVINPARQGDLANLPEGTREFLNAFVNNAVKGGAA